MVWAFSIPNQPLFQRYSLVNNGRERIRGWSSLLIECVHDGHVGGPKQYNDFPLGNIFYFYANIFYCFSPPTWPPCTHSIVNPFCVWQRNVDHKTYHIHRNENEQTKIRFSPVLGLKCIRRGRFLLQID